MGTTGEVAIILAAGKSARLGQPKQLLHYEGETLLARTIRVARAAGFDRPLCVLGREAELIKKAVGSHSADFTVNVDYASGMASSIHAGLRLASHLKPQWTSVLLMVCDQPRVTVDLLQKLRQVQTAEGRQITASHYLGRLGVPAIFARSLEAELMSLAGEMGARQLIAAHAHDVGVVDFPGGADDIDVPADIAKLRGAS